ncbi:lipid IV(A) 4-amino-4-deoxy-L-arabinosyltransferase [Rahnella variigena]|uniref:lipid IV(A) 4-amino-4-deoxy-L-arabinosyltransferase n=1 Tax=Rahnella variigena TaxID=574964 RepID=UPI002166CAB1|nr:lipid IV(A) 4-amino-4-deoxy-L-arabinosyltransferase [Rahnella variigena]
MKSIHLIVLLIAGFVLYYLLPMNLRALWQPDETRYAEISREMLASGNWIVPKFFGLNYFEKPVAGYWINNIGQGLFGHTNAGVRAGSVISTTLTAFLVAWLGWYMWHDRRLAIMSGVIYLTMLLVYGVGTYAVLDPIVTLWMTIVMCTLWLAFQAKTIGGKISWWIVTGLACGMGVMTKGFLVLAVPVVSCLPWVFLHRRKTELLIFGWLAVVSAVVIVLPWGLAIHYQEPDFWRWFFWVEHIQRFAGDNAQHQAPFWYYLPLMLVGALPWAGHLPGAIIGAWKKRLMAPQFWLLCFIIMPLILYSIGKGKLLTYILPCFAPLSLLIAHYIFFEDKGGAGINDWINITVGVIGMVGIVGGVAPWGIYPLYTYDELLRVAAAVLIFLGWAGAGWYSLMGGSARRYFSAVCPLNMALLVGFAVPAEIEDVKQPQAFITSVRETLQESRYILVQNPGIASAVAWELERSDIILFEDQGEMQYGLTKPEGRSQFVKANHFKQWLAHHRSAGSISVLLYLSTDEAANSVIYALPAPDATHSRGRLLLLQYFNDKGI